jgi:hypothetical protein
LLFGLWCVEWFLMAFFWVLMIGFLFLTRWAIGKHPFRSMPLPLVPAEFRAT